MARKKELVPMVNWVYDLILWVMSVLVDLFFREVHPRGSWKVPRRGPVIFVAAPHANQFVDPLILMRVIKMEAGRRIAWLIAEKSMRRKFIGGLARAAGAVPVGRALDSTKPGTGKIYLPDANNDATLVRGVGTQFEKECQIGGLLVLPSVNGTAANTEILEIHGNEEIKLKKEFKGDTAIGQLTGKTKVDGGENKVETSDIEKQDFQGTSYKTAPKVDQSLVYDAVFERLQSGGCVGIFPEGGSHDRTELLPLKPGVAIMALGSLAANPESGVKIVPCGMNYFHAHKFRSRAVVEFGPPVDVPTELVEMYKSGERREATRQLLEIVYQALVAVTVTSPDYDTLMLIQAARRLYNPTNKKLPLPMIVELNRRLVKGYKQHKDDPRIVNLKKSVNDYNKQLWLLGVRDHQVEYAKFSIPKVIFTLIYRLGKLGVLAIGTLPGLVLFAPVFISSKMISIKKSREALAASTVKLQGRDVMATWKLLVALAFAPILYATYTILLTYWTHKNRVQGYMPQWVPLWMVVIFGVVFFPSVTFAALRIGETGMDIVKSLRPLVLSLYPTSANTLQRLREKRATLSHEVTDVINTLGPEMFPDFDSARIIADPFRDCSLQDHKSPKSPRTHSRTSSGFPATPPTRSNANEGLASIGGGSSTQGYLPRNESFHDLSNIGLFASRPPSRSRSRSSSSGGKSGSAGFSVKAFSSISSKEGLEEVSKKIRGAMRERGKERRRKSEDGSGSWEFAESETENATPDSVAEGRKEV
ncbi:hypothetical protein IMSHALPRED_005280 [Imshaugia aleurites]|uniref:Phospholipid/glycerol acyltransferase domain-containing protein n=1 Tax=Imshaugia aleurites TaxID=172621 RepID=A0A8H3IBF1_9LECA|nr:hypothetical protein IMSHALPRED_005280 [Imshaugia aleurites]